MDPFAIGADPGRTVADPPFVLGETGGADPETAGAAPAERHGLATAAALTVFTALAITVVIAANGLISHFGAA